MGETVYCVFQYYVDGGVSQEMLLEIFKTEELAKKYVEECKSEDSAAKYDYLPFVVIEE